MFDCGGRKDAVKLFDSCKCQLGHKDFQFLERSIAENPIADQEGTFIIENVLPIHDGLLIYNNLIELENS